MKLLTGKAGETPVWHLLLLFLAVAVVLMAVKEFLFVDNIVVTADHGSFVKRSFFSPLSAAQKAEAAAKVSDSLNAKNEGK